MKKTLALLFALVMVLIVGATAESADLTGYIGSAYSGVDPWGGTLTVTVRDIRDGRMDWTFTDDGETKLLSSYAPGVKRILTWNENGEIADTQVEYEDGEAAFSIDDEDRLRWDDKKENAAGDMRFERGVLPQP